MNATFEKWMAPLPVGARLLEEVESDCAEVSRDVDMTCRRQVTQISERTNCDESQKYADVDNRNDADVDNRSVE